MGRRVTEIPRWPHGKPEAGVMEGTGLKPFLTVVVKAEVPYVVPGTGEHTQLDKRLFFKNPTSSFLLSFLFWFPFPEAQFRRLLEHALPVG